MGCLGFLAMAFWIVVLLIALLIILLPPSTLFGN